jgi:hypothetical protein
METIRQKRGPPITIREPKDWRKKVDPVYIRMIEQYRIIVDLSRSSSEADRQEADRLRRNPPQDLVEDLRRLREQRRRSCLVILPVSSAILGSDDPMWPFRM